MAMIKGLGEAVACNGANMERATFEVMLDRINSTLAEADQIVNAIRDKIHGPCPEKESNGIRKDVGLMGQLTEAVIRSETIVKQIRDIATILA